MDVDAPRTGSRAMEPDEPREGPTDPGLSGGQVFLDLVRVLAITQPGDFSQISSAAAGDRRNWRKSDRRACGSGGPESWVSRTHGLSAVAPFRATRSPQPSIVGDEIRKSSSRLQRRHALSAGGLARSANRPKQAERERAVPPMVPISRLWGQLEYATTGVPAVLVVSP
jgi:hypothetical protein